MSKEFSDQPQHQAEQTSSIGGTWPPEFTSFNRIKSIYPKIISSSYELAKFFDMFLISTFRMLDMPYLENRSNLPTRVQYRGIMEASVLIAYKNELLPFVEAIIPLDTGKFGIEPLLIYLAKNSHLRKPNDRDMAMVYQNVSQAEQCFSKTPAQMLDRAMINGYQLSIPGNWTNADIDQLANLYSRFGWKNHEVAQMVHKTNNRICIARLNQQIVSAGIAELANVKIDDQKFTMAEITEAATLAEHGGQGLYTAISATLLTYLAKQNPVDLVFGECNGLSLPVLKTAKTQGRTFATETGKQYGFSNSGILKQQVPIEGVPKVTQYNDLVPAFLTQSQLINLYG